MTPETTRFAPSPTGRLHLGHAYAALIAHDFARKSGGTFLLRFEDIDFTRVRPEYYGLIEDDLRWLGLTWEGTPIRQSERLGEYGKALITLQETGVVYPCFCTRREIEEELARMTHAPHGPEGALYPGICRAVSDAERAQRIATGEVHCWRLDAEKAACITGPLTFIDERHGVIPVDATLLGDVILARKDIATSYHLAVVVDDAWQKVTLVTRGEDLLSSTHVHRLLQALLGVPEPRYHHHKIITDDTGKRLAKRHDALSLDHLRATHTPEQIREMLV